MADKTQEKESRVLAPRKSFLGLNRWEPDMDRMMDDFFGRRTRSLWPERWLGGEGMDFRAPAVDLYEDKNDIVVKAELPGIDKDNIEINLTDHTLTIRGEKKKEEELQEENYYRSERSYGSFMRTLELPADVQTENVKASFKNGILEVRLPKNEDAKTKGVQVKID
jgi:HSP20 family protein